MKLYRMITSPIRVLPRFLIAGGQKCGTSSLHSALDRHPCVSAGTAKELAFFDRKFDRGLAWYRMHFPTRIRGLWNSLGSEAPFMTFESTVSYLYHPLAPKRIANTLPNVKIIVMIRNPIERAYSHFNYRKKVWGDKSFSTFEDAVEAEIDEHIAREEYRKLQLDENYPCKTYYKYSLLSRGIYVQQITNLMRYVSKDRVLILKSEDFFNDPVSAFISVLKFLELPVRHADRLVVKKRGIYEKPMKTSTREKLATYFEPYNQRLYDLIGVDYNWR